MLTKTIHINLSKAARSRGFSMVEALVAGLILSFGVLGIVGMQILGLSTNKSASYRSIASIKANEMINRVMANPAAADTGQYNSSTTAADGCKTLAACTAVQIAQNDVFEWQAELTRQLPGGLGVVCRTDAPSTSTNITATAAAATCSANGAQYVIYISWNDSKKVGDQVRLFKTVFAPFRKVAP